MDRRDSMISAFRVCPAAGGIDIDIDHTKCRKSRLEIMESLPFIAQSTGHWLSMDQMITICDEVGNFFI